MCFGRKTMRSGKSQFCFTYVQAGSGIYQDNSKDGNFKIFIFWSQIPRSWWITATQGAVHSLSCFEAIFIPVHFKMRRGGLCPETPVKSVKRDERFNKVFKASSCLCRLFSGRWRLQWGWHRRWAPCFSKNILVIGWADLSNQCYSAQGNASSAGNELLCSAKSLCFGAWLLSVSCFMFQTLYQESHGQQGLWAW